VKIFALSFLLPVFFGAVSAFGQKTIRQVDFQNFTYTALCGAEKEIDAVPVKATDGTIKNARLVDGIYQAIDENLPMYFDVEKPLYGDLTGDGKEEAVIRAQCSNGGTGQPTEGFIYTMRGGKPFLLARLESGDRGHLGIVGVKIQGKNLIVTRNDPQGASDCCATHTLTFVLKWDGKKFAYVGKSVRRKIIFL
jgi:hypothetical protein